MEKSLDKIINKKSNYLLIYIFINIGFLFSFFIKYENNFITILNNMINLFIGLFICIDLPIYLNKTYTELIKKQKLKPETLTYKITTNMLFNKFLKIFFIFLITIFPFINGFKIGHTPSLISFISNICYSFGLTLFCALIIKYGYLTPNYEKRNIVSTLYIILGLFPIITRFYPKILADALTIFNGKFMDVVVCSLTFILMTATLALLAFTYNMVLEHPSCKKQLSDIGKDYFKATLFIILFSIASFMLFFMLNLVKVQDWTSQLNYDFQLLIGLNIICIILLGLVYLIIKFLQYFSNATIYCLGILKIDCI